MGGFRQSPLITFTEGKKMSRSDNLYALPPDLPVPLDDGSCDHLPGLLWPSVSLLSTNGRRVSLAAVEAEWVVVYFYPRTGLPDQDPPGGLAAWDSIPGVRGCTPQACSYRDHYSELIRRGIQVFGISTQDSDYQREAVNRLHLPFELLSDSELELARALRLPTFSVAGYTLIKRLTLIGSGGCIERCFYPVFPPDADAENVLSYIDGRRG
jgi:peroxiredoxin